MYDNKRGMIRCLFLEGSWTCSDCDMRKAGICTEEFYKKHGYFEGELDGYNTRPKD